MHLSVHQLMPCLHHKGAYVVLCFVCPAWYGTPEVDGKWVHWNHEVLPHWGGNAVNSKYPTVGSKHKPPETIGSNFYPSLGPYSSRNASVIRAHVEMLARAGIGVLVYSWWGRVGDANGDPTDDSTIAQVANACLDWRIKLAFHLEPYKGRNAASVRLDLEHLLARYGHHSALYRIGPLPAFYVYDSYHTSKEEWATLLGVSCSRVPPELCCWRRVLLQGARREGRRKLCGGSRGVGQS
jgi:glycoprotein endo-alpha-1,2-mannosidase